MSKIRYNAKQRKERFEEQCINLKRWINPDTRIYGLVTRVAPNGMSRHIRLFIVNEGNIHEITFNASIVIDEPYFDDTNSLRVQGTGMDMVFDTIMNLWVALFPDLWKGDASPINWTSL